MENTSLPLILQTLRMWCSDMNSFNACEYAWYQRWCFRAECYEFMTLEADRANQVRRTIFASSQRRKWGRRVVLIMRSCYHNDTSSQLAADSVSIFKGSFWHQRLWGVEMDAAVLNVICFTVKCSHLAFFFFIEELTRYDRLGQTKTELTTTGKTCSTVLLYV